MRGKFTLSRPAAVPGTEPRDEGVAPDNLAGRLAVRSYEAGKITTLGQSTIEALARKGEVPCVRVGRAVLFPVSALRDWLHAQAMDNLGKALEAGDDEETEPGSEDEN